MAKSPFKDDAELKDEIDVFLARHSAVFGQEAKRTSGFFELAAYNYLIRYYETNGFQVAPQNLKGLANDEFVYALSPNAKPATCSYLLVEKKYAEGIHRFEIRHNVRIQSAHDSEIFVSPDYAIVAENSIESIRKPDYYNGKADYSFVSSNAIYTFGETKHYQPGAELVLNFVGLVNELMPALMNASFPTKRPMHLGPSLFVSGTGSLHVTKIAESLAKRYAINVFLGLFAAPSQVYSVKHSKKVVKIGSSS